MLIPDGVATVTLHYPAGKIGGFDRKHAPPLTITTTGDASTLTGWTTQNPGMAGVCLPSCSVDGGTSADGGACFPNSTCIATTAAGPDCEP